MKFGQFEINTFVEQRFKFDGGTMFGVVPKTLWEKLITPDKNNLIPMVSNYFVLKAHGKIMLLDSGLGDVLDDRDRKVYGTEGVTSIESGLAELDLTPDDIDYAILTHLHVDHSSGLFKSEDGELVTRFPNATIFATKREWQDAMSPNERTSAIYKPERLQVLKDSGKLELIDANTELFPGIRAVHTGGHTAGHFAIEMESGNQKVWFYSDVLFSSLHMPVAYVPALDLYPVDTMNIKRQKLPEIIGDKVIMAYVHDINTPMATVEQQGKEFTIHAVEGEFHTQR
jgi:glyoxylase-like metal-dependent hydrolase (beta-lactamase superfamily II)